MEVHPRSPACARANWADRRVEHHKTIAIGVDIGGTFTDVVLLDEVEGRITSAKVLTTPEQPEEAVLAAVAQALAELRDKGVKLLDTKPRLGHANSRIAFLDPTSTNDVLIELVELAPGHAQAPGPAQEQLPR